MKERKIKLILLFLLLLVLSVFIINPVFPHEIFLQHIPTIIVTGFLIYAVVKNSISDKAFLCLTLLLTIHSIGARWNYSFTPYDHWFRSSLRVSINDYFHSERNHYDRFVHFMYGFLLIIPVSEIYSKWGKMPGKKLSNHVAFLFVLASSLIYELIEWILAVYMSPEDAEAYNGQQGDMWDAQKDMALAMLGAILMIIILRFINRFKKTQSETQF